MSIKLERNSVFHCPICDNWVGFNDWNFEGETCDFCDNEIDFMLNMDNDYIEAKTIHDLKEWERKVS